MTRPKRHIATATHGRVNAGAASNAARPRLSGWGFIPAAAAIVAALQTAFYLIIKPYLRGTEGVFTTFAHNAAADVVVIAAFYGVLAALSTAPFVRKRLPPSLGVPVGVVALLFLTLWKPVNNAFFPYAFTAGSFLGNAGFAATTAAAAYLAANVFGRVNKAVRFPGRRVFWPAAALVVCAHTVPHLNTPTARVPLVSRSPHSRAANVVLITVDALRYDYVSANGSRAAATPNLDRFAARAHRFRNCYTLSTHTPRAMMSMVTSTYPFTHGCDNKYPLPPEIPTLAEILRRDGYFTVARLYNANLNGNLGFARGFERFRCYTGGGPAFLTSTPFAELYAYFSGRFAPPGGADATRNMTADVMEDIPYLRDHAPYFLWVHLLDPHAPLTPPPAYVPETVKDSESWAAFYASKWDKVELYRRCEPELIKNLYAAEVAYTDAVLGRILARLEETGAFSDTLIVVTADHGEELFDHGSFGHGHQVYEETAHIPLFLYIPGTPGGDVDQPVSLADVAPTVLTYAGLGIPSHMVGSDLRALSEGGPAAARSIVTVGEARYENLAAIRGDGYALILNGENDKPQLFPLANDRSQRTDLADQNPAAVSRLAARLRGLKEKYRRRPGPAPTAVSPEDRDAIKALGYTD